MQIKINVEVKQDGNTLRTFSNLPVKLWDTAKENIAEYGGEMLHLCFIGTSGKVNIQNKIRSYAAATKESGEFENSDNAVKSFAASCSVTVGTGSELQSERATQESKMDADALAKHNAAMAYAEKFNKQTRENVKSRKDVKEESAQ